MEFGHTQPVQVHFDDLDAMGLLHNSRYSLLVERAMSAFWLGKGWSLNPAESAFIDVFLVVKEFKVTYHVPIIGASTPLVDIWIDRMGRTSVLYGFRIVSADRSVIHAEGHRVNVNVDPRTLQPMPFSNETRAAASELERVH